MWKVLIAKEWRETAWIALLGLAVWMMFATDVIGIGLFPWSSRRPSDIPFVSDGFPTTFLMVAVGLTIALGFRQSVIESFQDTWVFLLHRPLPRNQLIASKLVVGLMLYMVCAVVPLVVVGMWAATPRTHASPFYWSMTLPAWRYLLSMTVIYLGAFLSGIRPARWFGTRLFPLVAAAVLAGLIQMVPWWWPLGVMAVLLVDALLAVSIFYVAESSDLA